jgi:hypothetical protein
MNHSLTEKLGLLFVLIGAASFIIKVYSLFAF